MFVGLTLGVAVVFSVDIANQSAKRAFALSLDSITGRTTHQIVGGVSGIDEGIYTQLRTRLGVRQSAPVVEGTLTVQGPDGSESLQLLGIDIFSEPMFRSQLSSLQDVGEPGDATRESLALLEFGAVFTGNSTAARLGLSIGDTVKVKAGGATRAVKLANVIDTTHQAAFDSMVMTDIATAQWLLDMSGRLSRIDLITDNPAQLEEIKNTFSEVSIADASRRNNALVQMTGAFHTNLLAMSLLALLVGAFLIYNTVTLSVLQRRMLFGQLRVAGVDRQALASAIVIEVLAFTLLGLVAGLLAGYALGGVLLNLVTRTINDLYFTLEVRQLNVSVFNVLKITVMAVLAALVAVAVPAMEAANSPPVTLTQRSALESKTGRLLPWLATGGCALGVLGFLMLWLSASLLMAFCALFMIVIGYSLLIPGSLYWAARLTGKMSFSGAGVTGNYPMRSLSASLSRVAVAVTALAVAVSATAGVGIMIGSFRASVADWLDQTLQADFYVRDSESLDNALPQEFVDAVDSLAIVTGKRLSRMFDVDAGGTPARLLALELTGDMNRGLSLIGHHTSVDEQWTQWSAPDSLFISEPLAWQLALNAGEKLSITTENGVRDFHIAGVFTDYGAGRGLIIMPMATMHLHWQDRGLSSIGVSLNAGSVDDADRFRRLVKPWPQLLVRSDGDIRELSMRIFDQTFAITHILRLLTAGVAFVGILSALLALTLERRHEFAVLRALGLTPNEMRRVLLSQTAWMGLIAGLLALPLGILMSGILVAVINRRSFGWTMQYSVSTGVLWESVALAFIAALLAAIYPAWRIGRMLPTQALRQR